MRELPEPVANTLDLALAVDGDTAAGLAEATGATAPLEPPQKTEPPLEPPHEPQLEQAQAGTAAHGHTAAGVATPTAGAAASRTATAAHVSGGFWAESVRDAGAEGRCSGVEPPGPGALYIAARVR